MIERFRQSVIPGMGAATVRVDDLVLTPGHIAKDVVEHFPLTGKVLDPCKGNGAFYDHLEAGADWCEIRDGRDFFEWDSPVDWIVSNPPYSIFSDFLRHSFRVAENIVYLVPINKVFNSDKMVREIWRWGGVPEVYVISSGGRLGFPIGFCIGAVHFKRGYKGGIQITFRNE